MEHLWELIRYLRAHPGAVLGAAIVLGAIFYLLNRKSKLSREADGRIEQLRKERGGYYNKLRKPQ